VVIKEVIPDKGRIEALKRKEGSFVLITNVPEEELTDRDVLITYKKQGIVERSFSRLKRPMMADTIFLKTPKRIEALLAFVYIALMFQSIMQAIARYRAMKIPNLPKITYAKRKLENPTYELIAYLLEPFVLISAEKPIEISCKVPEIEEYMELFLFLIDAQDC